MGTFQNNPSIVWVHPKSTHVGPLAWGNINFACNQLNYQIT
jgi:hypothetical protein